MIEFFPSRAIALTVAGFSVHWYGIMYLLAFITAFLLLPRLQKYRSLTLSRDEWSTIVSWAVGGVIVGGRLGYVAFYEPAYFIARPLEIFAVWQGGMSSHGGFVGVVLALLWLCRRKGYSALQIADVAVIPAALGLALGRVGNFINLELYGTVTALPWGMEIPGVEGLRHPTQIYAMMKDFLIAAVCFTHLRSVRGIPYGRTFSIFLMMYGCLRFIVEYFRVETHSGLPILGYEITRGQIYTIPVFLAGFLLFILLKRREVGRL